MRQTKHGIEILNATADLEVNITAQDIVDGIAYDAERCAGALACVRTIPDVVKAEFRRSRVYLLKQVVGTCEQVWLRYMPPKKMFALEAINDVLAKNLDAATKYAGPIVLRAVPEGKRATGKQQGSDKAKGEEKVKRVYHRVPMRDNASTSST